MLDAELTEKLKELKLQTLIDFLKNIAGLEDKKDDFESKINDFECDIQSLKSQLWDSDAEIEKLKEKVTSLENKKWVMIEE